MLLYNIYTTAVILTGRLAGTDGMYGYGGRCCVWCVLFSIDTSACCCCCGNEIELKNAPAGGGGFSQG